MKYVKGLGDIMKLEIEFNAMDISSDNAKETIARLNLNWIRKITVVDNEDTLLKAITVKDKNKINELSEKAKRGEIVRIM